jgi:hypothetical protein
MASSRPALAKLMRLCPQNKNKGAKGMAEEAEHLNAFASASKTEKCQDSITCCVLPTQ